MMTMRGEVLEHFYSKNFRIITQEQIDGIEFTDISIKPYLHFPRPHTVGFEAGNKTRTRRFNASQNILDMVVCSLMRKKAKTGNKYRGMDYLLRVFRRFEEEGRNPYQILVSVLEKLLVHEVVFRRKIAGANVNKSAENTPTRKLDFAVKMLGLEIHRKSMRASKSIEETIYRTFMDIYNFQKGAAPDVIRRIEEIRQVAKSSR